MSRNNALSEELKRSREANLSLRQEMVNLTNALRKEREDKQELIHYCINQLSGIYADITSLEGQALDAAVVISKALEQNNLVNGELLIL